MEGWLVKAPERTGRGRMEEEWSLSAGECCCTSGGTGAKRTQPGTAFARAFGFDILRNTKCFWIFTRTFFYSASGTGLVRNQKLYVADEKHEH